VIPSAKHDRGLDVPKAGLLGVRPQMKDADLALVTWNEDRSLMSESFRGTVASILSSSDNARVFVVTSKDAMEGKTTVVTNLGIAFAEAKKRVLIIDADLRRPQLHTVFDICNDTGFSDVLQGGDAVVKKLQACIRATNVPDLYVLPSGPGTAAISRLIYSSEMDALLAQCRTSFDIVLVDCPPMAPYAEARVIGRKSDGVILVVRANRTSRDDVQDAYARLSEDGVPVLGCILNDWRMNESEARTYNNYYNTYENYQKPSRARKAERS
jgi:receptor protein-tyrosine kinase